MFVGGRYAGFWGWVFFESYKLMVLFPEKVDDNI